MILSLKCNVCRFRVTQCIETCSMHVFVLGRKRDHIDDGVRVDMSVWVVGSSMLEVSHCCWFCCNNSGEEFVFCKASRAPRVVAVVVHKRTQFSCRVFPICTIGELLIRVWNSAEIKRWTRLRFYFLFSKNFAEMRKF